MFAMFMVSLREGLEAFLIVAISLAYLRKTGRGHLAPAIYWGVAVSVVASFAAGLLLRETANKPAWEGALALVTGILVATLTIHMWRAAKTIKSEIGQRIEAATASRGAFLGIFLFTVLMISREGMETAMVINTLMFQIGSGDMLTGALIGTGLAATVAWAWSRYGHKVNLSRFFQVTAVFLGVFIVQLIIYAFHEFTEGGVLPFLDNEYWHIATEPYGPEGQYGQWISYGLVLLPAAWLALSWLRHPGVTHPARINTAN